MSQMPQVPLLVVQSVLYKNVLCVVHSSTVAKNISVSLCMLLLVVT